MQLSVVIPSLNAADTLGEQLAALAAQTWEGNYEVIVADNGSTDDTVALAESYRSRLPAMKIVDASETRGAAHARNAGAAAAAAERIAFVDADDVVAEGWVAAMHDALNAHAFVAGRIKPLVGPGCGRVLGRQVPQNEGLQPYTYPSFLPHAATANLGVRRRVHDAVGGFDEALLGLEDTDYCWRIQLDGVKLHFAPNATVYMRTRDTWRSMVRQSWHWGRYNVRLYRRYRPHGMPPLSWKTGLRKWSSIIRQAHRLRTVHDIETWLWRVAWNLGRLDGCLRYKILAI